MKSKMRSMYFFDAPIEYSMWALKSRLGRMSLPNLVRLWLPATLAPTLPFRNSTLRISSSVNLQLRLRQPRTAIMAPRSYSKTYKVPRRREFDPPKYLAFSRSFHGVEISRAVEKFSTCDADNSTTSVIIC
jgi:hypothetical protein